MIERIKTAYLKAGDKFQYFIHNNFYLITAVLVTVLSLTARLAVAFHPTRDVVFFVFKWMEEIQRLGFTNFYQVNSDYSPLFLFIVGLFTFLPAGNKVTTAGFTYYSNWMYYLKSWYFITEIAIAIGIYLILKEVTNSKKSGWLGYVIYLCLPVQFFNSAVWGNADVLYFVFFVYTVYFIIKKKSGLAFFFTGMCFGFKLQVVFILPLLVYLMLNKKLTFYKLILLPIGLLATFIPAYLCGAKFYEPFLFFGRQLGGYSNLTLGCANIWHLINVKAEVLEKFNLGATVLGLLLIGLFTAIVFAKNPKLTNENLIAVSTFLIAIVPMFLPHMHERYFYALDVFIVLYCIATKKRYYLVILMQLSSGVAYHNYLAGRHFILALGEDSVHIASWINIFVLTVLFLDILKLESDKSLQEKALEYKKTRL